MKKRVLHLVMVIAMGISLAACGGNNNAAPTPTTAPTETPGNNGGNGNAGTDEGEENPGTGEDADGNEDNNGNEGAEEPAEEGSARHLMNQLVDKNDRPAFIEADDQMLKDMYELDAAMLDDYIVLMPMMNISTTEFAIFKIKDAKDVAAVEEGVKKRAEAVQKSFESYLPDQYENAKNYKFVAQGEFVLFTIAKDADDVAAKFQEIAK